MLETGAEYYILNYEAVVLSGFADTSGFNFQPCPG
jgi:hypothetical protein